MRIRLPDSPVVYTTVMFMVLFAMLGMSIRSASEPPYEELNELFKKQIARQLSVNADLLVDLVDPERECYRGRDSGYYLLLHDKVLETLNTLDSFRQKVAGGDTSIALQNDIRYVIDEIDSVLLFSTRPEVRAGLSRQMPIAKIKIEEALRYFKRIPNENKITMVYALQSALLVSEEYVLSWLASDAYHCGCGFDPFEVISIPVRGWGYLGDRLKAIIMLVVYNRSFDPDITMNKGTVKNVENGIATCICPTSLLGLQNISGTASIEFGRRRDRKIVTKPWSFSYLVVAPGASMSIDKMHILYAGIANPVTLSAPGYDAEHVSLRVPGAVVKKVSNGKYEVIVAGAIQQLTAYLDATNEKELTTTLEGLQFRILPPPQPIVRLEQQAGRSISMAALDRPLRIVAEQDEEEVQFDYAIKGFEYSILHYGNKTVSGPFEVDGDLLRVNGVSNIAKGDRLILSNIRTMVGNLSLPPVTVSYTIL